MHQLPFMTVSAPSTTPFGRGPPPLTRGGSPKGRRGQITNPFSPFSAVQYAALARQRPDWSAVCAGAPIVRQKLAYANSGRTRFAPAAPLPPLTGGGGPKGRRGQTINTILTVVCRKMRCIQMTFADFFHQNIAKHPVPTTVPTPRHPATV